MSKRCMCVTCVTDNSDNTSINACLYIYVTPQGLEYVEQSIHFTSDTADVVLPFMIKIDSSFNLLGLLLYLISFWYFLIIYQIELCFWFKCQPYMFDKHTMPE